MPFFQGCILKNVLRNEQHRRERVQNWIVVTVTVKFESFLVGVNRVVGGHGGVVRPSQRLLGEMSFGHDAVYLYRVEDYVVDIGLYQIAARLRGCVVFQGSCLEAYLAECMTEHYRHYGRMLCAVRGELCETQVGLGVPVRGCGPVDLNSVLRTYLHLRDYRRTGIEDHVSGQRPEIRLLCKPQAFSETVLHFFARKERFVFGRIVIVGIIDRLYHKRLVERVVRGGYDALGRMRRHCREDQLILVNRDVVVLRAAKQRNSRKCYNRQSLRHSDCSYLFSSPGGAELPRPDGENIINNRFSQH